ncbi:MAG: glycosyl transferase family 90 [Rhizobium rhizophilum]|uniref:glycosyl transferase family 90 n=1 Tax=Rhizobium rhizophilum TaxID=1850373 RepID=UPI0039195E2F
MSATLNLRIARVLYYLRNAAREACPQGYFVAKRSRLFDWLSDADLVEIETRLGYYNKLTLPFSIPSKSHTISRTSRARSRYYFDFMEAARYFEGDLRVNTLFGDVVDVPEYPTFVKSRPVGDGNENSVLMKLDKFRHFQRVADPLPFLAKQSKLVWRGSANNARRRVVLEKFHDHSLFDVGATGGDAPVDWQKPFLTIGEQLRFRYILSIEGYDVATNLKWIMSSNSLCFSPKPRFETWFMEGRLEAGRHYVEIQDDMADLEEKFRYYEAHPEEAEKIGREAQKYVTQFFNERQEFILSLLVVEKYLHLSGQIHSSAALTILDRAREKGLDDVLASTMVA